MLTCCSASRANLSRNAQAALTSKEAELKEARKTPSKSTVSTSHQIRIQVPDVRIIPIVGCLRHGISGTGPSGDEDNDSPWELVDLVRSDVVELKTQIKAREMAC